MATTDVFAVPQTQMDVALINEEPPAAIWLSADGPTEELKLSVAASAGDEFTATSLLALLLIGLAAVLGPLSRFHQARDWLCAYAHLALAIAGVAWWLIAPFGWLGWLLVAAGLWRSLRFPTARLAPPSRWSSHHSRASTT